MAEPIVEARTLMDRGDPQRAAQILRTAIAEGRGGILARVTLGRALAASGDFARALDVLREACALAPGIADAALVFGETLLAAGFLPAGIAELNRAERLAPDHLGVRYALGCAWLEAGEPAKAMEWLSAIAATGSAFASRAAAKIAQAEAMAGAPRSAPSYVRHLFDQFSADYDRRMREELSYRAPAILRKFADLVLGGEKRKCAVLDLGCGTGLAGDAFADIAARLDGVDLSPAMIGKARGRGIYEALDVDDLENALLRKGPSYDLMLAADTFVYLGDLASVFRGTRGRLNAGGFLLFTVEKKEGSGYELGPKRRYRHSEAYLREEAARARLEVMGILECTPRTEAHEPVPGLAVALQRI